MISRLAVETSSPAESGLALLHVAAGWLHTVAFEKVTISHCSW